MKKFLAVFAVCSVLLASGLAALSVLPHSHGNDLDHSSHKSCPVYQFGLGHTDGMTSLTALVFVLFAVLYLVFSDKQAFSKPVFLFHPLRAPPTIS